MVLQDNLQVNPVIRFLKNAWPYVYKVINGSLYFVLSIIKSSVKAGVDQMKGM
jgi:hypothetical protein